MNNKEVWRLWEQIAAKYLESKWYKLIMYNYQKQFWEIDIIMKQWEEIVFIEVKTRKNQNYWEWFESVNQKKINKMLKTWEYYCLENNIDFDYCRFDVISIHLTNEEKYKIKHFEKIA